MLRLKHMRLASLRFVSFLRLAAATAIMVAIVGQCIHLSQHGQFNPANFFSYFTILSNLLAALMFVVSGMIAFRGEKPSLLVERLRGAATVYMVTTGIVFAVLLSKYDLGLTLPWVNMILHQIMPVVVALDWLLVPPRTKLRPGLWWSWLLFPIVYVIYTLIRGPIVGWYPYPFLDPAPDGYLHVIAYCIGITLFMSLLVLAVGWVGNARLPKIKKR